MLYLFVVTCFLLGYLFQQPALLGARRSVVLLHWINRWNLFLALPAMILVSIPRLNFSLEHVFAMLTPWVIFAITFCGFKIFSRNSSMGADERLVLILMISLGNTAFVGIPLIASQLGEEAVLGAVVYDQLGCFLLLSIFASTLIALRADAIESPSLFARVRQVFRFPPFICLLLALALALFGSEQWLDTVLWEWCEAALSLISASLLPLGILSVGLQFRFKIEALAVRFIAWVVAVKMLLIPALVFSAAKAMAIDVMVAQPVILQAAMPPQVTATLMLIAANIAPRLAAAVLSFSTLIAILTLPLWFYLVSYY